MARTRIILCNTMEPFVTGGSELFAAKLTEELNNAGYEAALITFPFRPGRFRREDLVTAALPWRHLDLTGQADVVIPMRFPTWLVTHPNKVVYLNHQLRAAYDLFGSPNGPKENQQTLDAKAFVEEVDARLADARKIFAVSRNVADRLKRFSGLDSEVLYHSLPYESLHRSEGYGDYILGVGRLVSMKRFDMLIRAVAQSTTPVRCLIVGEGRHRPQLERLIGELGVENRVRLLGWTSAEELVSLYAGALGVFYAPVDEDYGLVTLEAFYSARPVVTSVDSGGVLEFVSDGVNGRVLPVDPLAFSEVFDQLYLDRDEARRLGEGGFATSRQISWTECIRRLQAHF